jgi:Protein of unknown function (DUF3099)
MRRSDDRSWDLALGGCEVDCHDGVNGEGGGGAEEGHGDGQEIDEAAKKRPAGPGWERHPACPRFRRTALGRHVPVRASRDRAYLVLMSTCLALFILAWAVVRLYSITAAIVMSAVALAIPPVAVIIANAGDESSRRR